MPETILPKSPQEMPRMSCDREGRYLRNAFVGELSTADYVEIQFNPDDDDCDCHYDDSGEWTVEVCSGAKRFVGKDRNPIRAIWFAIEHLNAKDRSDYENWQSRRSAALAKLTADDKRLLNLQ